MYQTCVMAKKKKSKMGRPPLPPHMRRSVNASVRLTRAEYERLCQEARRRGITFSALIMEPWRGKRP